MQQGVRVGEAADPAGSSRISHPMRVLVVVFFFFNVKTSEVSLGCTTKRKARVVFRERSDLGRSISAGGRFSSLPGDLQ